MCTFTICNNEDRLPKSSESILLALGMLYLVLLLSAGFFKIIKLSYIIFNHRFIPKWKLKIKYIYSSSKPNNSGLHDKRNFQSLSELSSFLWLISILINVSSDALFAGWSFSSWRTVLKTCICTKFLRNNVTSWVSICQKLVACE